jgi:hypothetical protein
MVASLHGIHARSSAFEDEHPALARTWVPTSQQRALGRLYAVMQQHTVCVLAGNLHNTHQDTACCVLYPAAAAAAAAGAG